MQDQQTPVFNNMSVMICSYRELICSTHRQKGQVSIAFAEEGGEDKSKAVFISSSSEYSPALISKWLLIYCREEVVGRLRRREGWGGWKNNRLKDGNTVHRWVQWSGKPYQAASLGLMLQCSKKRATDKQKNLFC